MRRALGSCCVCLKAIYFYPKATVDKECLRCAECVEKDMPDYYTPETLAAKEAEEQGPYHKRLAHYQQNQLKEAQ